MGCKNSLLTEPIVKREKLVKREEVLVLAVVSGTVIASLRGFHLGIGIAARLASIHNIPGSFLSNLIIMAGCLCFLHNTLVTAAAIPDLTAATLTLSLNSTYTDQLGVIIGVLGNLLDVRFITAVTLPGDFACTLTVCLDNMRFIPVVFMLQGDGTACTGHIVLVTMRLNAQGFQTVAANYGMRSLVSVGNALPFMLAFRLIRFNRAACTRHVIHICMLFFTLRLQTVAANNGMGCFILVLYTLPFVAAFGLLNRDLIAAHVALAAAQIIAGAIRHILTALAGAGMGAVAIGSPCAPQVVTRRFSGHAALAHVAARTIETVASAMVKLLTTNLAIAAMGNITIRDPRSS